MKWVHPAWKVLGIEPTSDTRAIRIAYAAKLKAIDPEADPGAFVILREAFDAAQVQAQWVDQPDEDETAAIDAPPFAAAAAPSDERWAAEPATPDAHAKALGAMLYAHDPGGPRATPEESEAMLTHWRAIVADPRMQELAFFADAEQWFAETIARTSTFSDPLVIPAADHFGWRDSDGGVHQSRVIAYLNYRCRALEFLDEIQQPGDEHYEAWCELTTPAGPGATRGRVLVKKIHRLLRYVRATYPDLEDRFDSARLDLWEPSRVAPPPQERAPGPTYDELLARRNWRIVWTLAACFLALCIVSELGKLITPPGPQRGTHGVPMVPPSALLDLEEPEAAIDRALAGRFGGALTGATIKAKNPALAAAIASLLQRESGNYATQGDFARDLDELLDDWYWYGVRNGSRELLSRYLNFSLDMTRAIRARDTVDCNSFIERGSRWRPGLGLPAEMEKRDAALMVRALLETDGSKHAIPSAMVPATIIAVTARRAHVGIPVVERWLGDPRIGPARCAVTIAFTEATLAQPGPQALAILRTL